MLPRRESRARHNTSSSHTPSVAGDLDHSPTRLSHADIDHPNGTAADETTSLLAKRDDDEDDCTRVETYGEAVALLIKSSLPMVMGFMLEGLLNISTTAIAG